MFLQTDEMHQDPPRPSGSPAISIENGTFSWGLGAPALLSDVHLNVMPGQLIMVVGSVGTGKSSLLSAMLGEMTAKRGTVELRGRVAYTQQDPWIQNATLKNNGEPCFWCALER
jgi:ABC-type bacteriocin/lantibiotic exporter with double-glycine peptidase domain